MHQIENIFEKCEVNC